MTVLRDYAAEVTQLSLAQERVPYDEVAGPDGTLRQSWRRLAADSVDLDSGGLRRVRNDIGRFLLDDGVVFSPPGQGHVPWRLDPIPLVIEADEWSHLEKGLAQRAELLNAIVVDLYGQQSLLSSGLIPPAIIFGHSGYHRGIARKSAYDASPLVITATDLGRNSEGEWQVLADRAQAPSGIGFAMENRKVLSRILPASYRSAGLHRLAPFYQALRSALLQSGPDGVQNPRVVVLSPGPMSETAYDQAAIASSLGFPLVEGADLTVRDGAVWMRVLDRLERVDVIVRRVDSEWSDPLELRSESQLGVTGLSEAVRRGNVRVVNGLGSGILENPGLIPFMSAMCERLLDEPLRLPSVQTYWTGDARGREIVLDRLDSLRIKRIDPPFDTSELPRDELRSQILAEPHRFVGQEPSTLSVSPTLVSDRLEPREVTLRTFALRYGSSYRPMIGGLATAKVKDSPGISKDVWVLKSSSDEPDQGFTDLLPFANSREPVAAGPRVLDDLYWLGRYTERMEQTVRLLLTAHVLAADFKDRPYSSGGATLRVLLEVLNGLSPSEFTIEQTDENFRSLMLDASRRGSLASILERLREIAQSVRDQVSPDLFRVFGAIDRAVDVVRQSPQSWQIGESAGRILTDVLAVGGVTSNMVRDTGWHVLEAGRCLERSQQLCGLLGASLSVRRGIDVDRDVHLAVLQASESAVTHQRRYRGFLRAANVLDLMLLDADNPRGLRFNLEQLRHHVEVLPDSSGSSRPERLVDDLLDELDRVEISALIAIEGEHRPNLARFSNSMLRQLRGLSEAIHRLHLSAGPTPQQLEFAAAQES